MILHAMKKSDWEQCRKNKTYGRYSLEKFGFIHCSDVKDIVEVANSNFVGNGEMVLLCIEPSKVHAPIQWEDLRNCGTQFPHIYGELNLDAVLEVLDFPMNDDGTFILPRWLEKYTLRSEQEMLALILKVAKEDERIRAVYLNGSRANPYVKKDRYQDYDIVYVVTETKSFLENKRWISVFGEIAIVQEPDSNDIGLGGKHDLNRFYTWLMLFKDGNRIDLKVQIKEKMLEEYTKDKLTVPLLDKDHCLPQIPSATDEDYWVKKPTELQYISCCNEFWWCLNNVAKGVARDELSYAMGMFHGPVRDMLMKMIEWYIGIGADFSVSAGKYGKFFKKYLPKDIYEMYAKTYSDSEYENLWAAIFTACGLFRKLALIVSGHFQYSYNHSEDANMIEYLMKMKDNCCLSARGPKSFFESTNINT